MGRAFMGQHARLCSSATRWAHEERPALIGRGVKRAGLTVLDVGIAAEPVFALLGRVFLPNLRVGTSWHWASR